MSVLLTALGIRIEWAKARARKSRWTEEVFYVREDMRRTLRSLIYEAGCWTARSKNDFSGEPLDIAEGKRVYALKQARLFLDLKTDFESIWSGPVKVGVDKHGKDKILRADDIRLEDSSLPAAEV